MAIGGMFMAIGGIFMAIGGIFMTIDQKRGIFMTIDQKRGVFMTIRVYFQNLPKKGIFKYSDLINLIVYYEFLIKI